MNVFRLGSLVCVFAMARVAYAYASPFGTSWVVLATVSGAVAGYFIVGPIAGALFIMPFEGVARLWRYLRTGCWSEPARVMKYENTGDGFSMAGTRNGLITYREGAKTLQIYFELSGVPAKYDIMLSPVNLKEWKSPAGEKLSEEKQRWILTRLREWLAINRIRTDIDLLPRTCESSEKECVMPDCKNKAVKESALCLQHIDDSALGR